MKEGVHKGSPIKGLVGNRGEPAEPVNRGSGHANYRKLNDFICKKCSFLTL